MVTRALKEYGVESIKLNLRGRRSYPDRLFFIAGGKPLFLELKRPGKRPTPGQADIHLGLRAKGYEVQWADNFEDAMSFISMSVKRAAFVAKQNRERERKV